MLSFRPMHRTIGRNYIRWLCEGFSYLEKKRRKKKWQNRSNIFLAARSPISERTQTTAYARRSKMMGPLLLFLLPPRSLLFALLVSSMFARQDSTEKLQKPGECRPPGWWWWWWWKSPHPFNSVVVVAENGNIARATEECQHSRGFFFLSLSGRSGDDDDKMGSDDREKKSNPRFINALFLPTFFLSLSRLSFRSFSLSRLSSLWNIENSIDEENFVRLWKVVYS